MSLVPVLVLSYYFPPMAGAGTQRYGKLVRDLPALGFRPIVIAADEDRPGAHSLAHDPSLLRDVPPEATVIRVPSMERTEPTTGERLDPLRLTSGARELAWARRAATRAESIARVHRPRAIVATVSPYAVAPVARRLARRLGLPLVLDLRDPWALDGWRSFRTRGQARLDLRRMARCLADADAVVANCPAAARLYRSLPGVDPRRVVVIPNGFDEADFDSVTPPLMPDGARDPSARRRLVHVGSLHDPDPDSIATGESDRPHTRRPVARVGRSGRTLLEALARLAARRPGLADELRVDLHGWTHPGHHALAARLGVDEMIHVHGYCDHDDAVAHLCAADGVFVALHGRAGRPRSRGLSVPGKLYEALASERPVLASMPPGDASELVRLVGAGDPVAPGDAPGLAARVEAWLDGRGATGADRRQLAPFTRTALAGRVARVLEALLDGRVPTDHGDPWTELRAAIASAPAIRTTRRAA